MARKDQLREQRTNTVFNAMSRQQESAIIQALQRVIDDMSRRFGAKVTLVHKKQWYMKDMVTEL